MYDLVDYSFKKRDDLTIKDSGQQASESFLDTNPTSKYIRNKIRRKEESDIITPTSRSDNGGLILSYATFPNQPNVSGAASFQLRPVEIANKRGDLEGFLASYNDGTRNNRTKKLDDTLREITEDNRPDDRSLVNMIVSPVGYHSIEEKELPQNHPDKNISDEKDLEGIIYGGLLYTFSATEDIETERRIIKMR